MFRLTTCFQSEFRNEMHKGCSSQFKGSLRLQAIEHVFASMYSLVSEHHASNIDLVFELYPNEACILLRKRTLRVERSLNCSCKVGSGLVAHLDIDRKANKYVEGSRFGLCVDGHGPGNGA